MKLKRPVLIALVVCFFAGGLLIVAATQGVAQDSTPPADDASPFAGTAVASPEGSPSASPVPAGSPSSASEATIVMGQPAELSFDPSELTIAANTDVSINLPNEGNQAHDFHIRELNVHSSDIESGDSTTVTINAEPGEYEFYCDVLGHRESGMVGTLIVQ